MRFGKGYLFSQKWISDGGGRESTADWSTPQCEPLPAFKKTRKRWAEYFVQKKIMSRFARLLRRNEAKDLFPQKDHPKEGCPFSEKEIAECRDILCKFLEAETGRKPAVTLFHDANRPVISAQNRSRGPSQGPGAPVFRAASSRGDEEGPRGPESL